MAEIAGTGGEVMTQGIDGMYERCTSFRAKGATFAKFRAVFRFDVARGHPSKCAVTIQATTLARYASIAQSAGLVPIVEPEVSVFDGSNTIDESAKVTQEVLSAVYRALVTHNVLLEGTPFLATMAEATSLDLARISCCALTGS